MPLLTSLFALLTVAVSLAAADKCGSASYSPAQYYCFDGNFLCPKANGEQYLRCGAGCYSASQYDCANGTLKPHTTANDGTLERCGKQPYKASEYYCFDAATDPFLCPISSSGTGTYVRCGGSCYLPTQYSCRNGKLDGSKPDVPPGSTCVREYGDCEIELPTGGITIARCCGGENFACVATKCRDLRKLGGGGG